MKPYKPSHFHFVDARSTTLIIGKTIFPSLKICDFLFLALLDLIRYVFILRNFKIHVLEVGKV